MTEGPQLLEQRTISGRGIIQIGEQYQDARIYWLYVQLLREPHPDYKSNKFPRQKGNYANILWLQGEYVCKQEVMEYELQRWDWTGDVTGQVKISQECITDVDALRLQAAVALFGKTLGLGRPITINPIPSGFDKIVIECRDGAAADFQLWCQLYDKCSTRTFDPPPPAGQPPLPRPPYPPGVPFDGKNGRPDISPPYDGGNDGGDTVPSPGDKPSDPPPVYDDCTSLTLTVYYDRLLEGVMSRQNFTIVAYAPLGGIRADEVSSGGSSLFLQCRGVTPGGCVASGDYRINRGLGEWSNPSYTVST